MKFVSALTCLLALSPSSSYATTEETKNRKLQDQSLLELVDGTVLATAVGLAGLTDALSGDGPFTVLAPSDEALGAVPGKFLEPAYKFHLRDVLLFHVLNGAITSDMLMEGMVAPTLLTGESVTVSLASGVSFSPSLTGEATVTTANVAATNGVAHLIDDVLTPALITNSIADIASTAGFSTLLTAATEAGLAGALGMDGNYTVLAPTDAAFSGVTNLDDIIADKDLLTSILSFHVIPAVVHSSTLMAMGSAPTLGSDNMLSYEVMDGTVTFSGANSATVTQADILANNGIIHVIDTVLLPPEDMMTTAPSMAPAADGTSDSPAIARKAFFLIGSVVASVLLL